MSNVLAWILLKSVTFATSSSSSTENFYISLMLAMDVMIFHYVQSP